jgi:hypothetical protein
MPAYLLAALLILLAAPLRAATISGTVADFDGTPIPNVQVTLSSASIQSFTLTSSTGYYSFESIATGNDYTLTPSKSGFVFTPLSRSYTALAADQPNQDFIFGKIWSGGGSNSLASNPANWTLGVAPVAGDVVRFDATGAGKTCYWDLATAVDTLEFQATFSSSVVAGVDITAKTISIAGGEFLMGSWEIHLSKNFTHTGGRFRAGPGGTIFFEGSTVQAVNMVVTDLGAGLYDSYFNGFRVASSSSVQLGSSVVADGTFNISTGRFEMLHSTLTLTGGTQSGLGGSFNWDDSGGQMAVSSGTVIFDSRQSGVYQIRELSINSFNNLTAAGSTTINVLSGIRARGTLRIEQSDGNPLLNLGTGFTHTFTNRAFIGPVASPSSVAMTIGVSTAIFQTGVIIGTATVQVNSGQFQVKSSSLQVGPQGELLVPSGESGLFIFSKLTQLFVNRGSLRILGPTIFTSSAPAVVRYTTDISGSIDIENQCVFDSLSTTGLRFSALATPAHLDGLFFQNGQLGGAALYFSPVSVSSLTINSASFDTSISTNVHAEVDPAVEANPNVYMIIATGTHSSSAFEYDPSNVVHWGTLGVPTGFSGRALNVSNIRWSWKISNNPLGFVVVSDTGAVVSPTLSASTTFWVETDLSPNVAYARAVRALVDDNQIDSSVATVYTEAAPASNAFFTDVIVSSLTFEWSLGGNPPSTIFQLDRSTDDVHYSQLGRGTLATLVPVHEVGLIPESTYFYRISVENGDGHVGVTPVTVSTRTLPVPPPVVYSVNPSSVPNLGVVTFTVTGAHIQSNALLRVKRSGPVELVVQNVTVLSETSIQGTVGVTGALATGWDVEIENPDGKLSAGSGVGIFNVVDAPSVYPITTANYVAISPLALTTVGGGSLLSLAANAMINGRLYISDDPQGTPLSTAVSLVDSATSALANLIYIPGTLREILAFTAQGPYTAGFNNKVSLGISFPDADHDGIVDSITLRRSTLRMMTLNVDTGAWEPLVGSAIDIVNNRVSAPLNHFSIYALFGSPAAADLSEARVYPSPWKPGSKGVFDAEHLTFTNLTEAGEIRIYSAAGKFVKSLRYVPMEQGIISWDGKDENGAPLTSGMYLIYIQSSTGVKASFKFGVER